METLNTILSLIKENNNKNNLIPIIIIPCNCNNCNNSNNEENIKIKRKHTDNIKSDIKIKHHKNNENNKIEKKEKKISKNDKKEVENKSIVKKDKKKIKDKTNKNKKKDNKKDNKTQLITQNSINTNKTIENDNNDDELIIIKKIDTDLRIKPYKWIPPRVKYGERIDQTPKKTQPKKSETPKNIQPKKPKTSIQTPIQNKRLSNSFTYNLNIFLVYQLKRKKKIIMYYQKIIPNINQ